MLVSGWSSLGLLALVDTGDVAVLWRLSAGMGAGVRGVLTVVVAIDVGGLGARQPR